jgi:hypothetical protein
MATRFAVDLDDDQARAIRHLSQRYGISEEAVIEQLLDLGLEEIEERVA